MVSATFLSAHLTCNTRAIMPEAMGAAAEVPEKDVVQPLWMLASVVTWRNTSVDIMQLESFPGHALCGPGVRYTARV